MRGAVVACVALTVAALAGCGRKGTATDAGADADADAGAADAADARAGDARVSASDDGATIDERARDATGPTLPATVEATCRLNGCLRAATYVGTYAREALAMFLEPGVTIDNGYEVWRITYYTDGREARASVTFPHPRAPPAAGYAIGLITPGTVGLADECAAGNTVAGTGLAAFYGAYGRVGAAIDYPGLGTEGLHPYLVREVEARSALDGIRAVSVLARREGVPLSGQSVIAGLSQGGHAAISAAAEHATYAPELDIRGFAAAAPANAFLEQWASGVAVSGVHLSYHAVVVHAWATFYRHEGSPLFAEGIRDSVPGWMESLCTYPIDGRQLSDVIPEDPALVFDPAFLAAYRSASLTAYPAIERGFSANRLTPYRQTAPLLVYQGTADTIVPAWMTRATVDMLRRGGVTVDYREVEGGTHTNVAFSFVASNQLRSTEARAWGTGSP